MDASKRYASQNILVRVRTRLSNVSMTGEQCHVLQVLQVRFPLSDDVAPMLQECIDCTAGMTCTFSV
jgi:hypothetical protein